MEQVQSLPSSFRDPSGWVYSQNQAILRQVNLRYKEDYDLLMGSGLYATLIKKDLLIPHTEVKISPLHPAVSYKVIKPEKIKFISYPYEWSFSQLKDAALLTLAVQKEALQSGMILKDASAFNIQFRDGSPIFIDTLSFTRYVNGTPWIAYRQFCQHFLVPLALMSYIDARLNKLSSQYIDGIPLDLGSRLLPASTWMNFGLLTHIHLHSKSQKQVRTIMEDTKRISTANISRNAMEALLESLQATIRNIKWDINKENWAEYYQDTNYSKTAFKEKERIVLEMLNQVKPKSVLDLGANTGFFSFLAANDAGCSVLSTDFDPGAVEMNYLHCKRNMTKNVLPLIIDLTNPSAAVGWNNLERDSFISRCQVDMVMALALVHHLTIANNVPLEYVSQLLSKLGRYLLIEFVPKEDSRAAILLSSRDDIFENYDLKGFKKAFEANFKLLLENKIPESERTILLFERNKVD